ncbi:MAG: 3-oxoacyl-ACP synthase [Bacteroidota bacterium]
MNKEFRTALFEACREKLKDRLHAFEEAMLRAQDFANEQEKSSAGDKYETSRAMAQLEREMNAAQATEAQNELQFLMKINPNLMSSKIIVGSIIQTSRALYFIGVGLNAIKLTGTDVITLSAKAPLSKALFGKQAGDIVHFNKMDIAIIAVY